MGYFAYKNTLKAMPKIAFFFCMTSMQDICRLIRERCFSSFTSSYGVPLRSKYPDSEMFFQKQKISRDVQNMMRKLRTYRSIPKKKICTSSSSLLIRSRKFSMTSRIKKIRLPKKNIRSRDVKSRLVDTWCMGTYIVPSTYLSKPLCTYLLVYSVPRHP